MKVFYTYTWFIDGIPKYVGKGTGERCMKHLFSKQAVHFGHILRHTSLDHKIVCSIVLVTTDEQAAFDKEVELIALYGRADLGKGTLLNHTDGGDGSSGRVFKHTDECKERMRQLKIGKALSKEHAAKIAEAQRGKPLTEAHKLKISQVKTGKSNGREGTKQSPETVAKRTASYKATVARRHEARLMEALL